MLSNKIKFKYLFIPVWFSLLSSFVYAQSIDDLKAKIQQTTDNKAQLEKEIAAYESQLKDIGEQASTLQNTIKSLDATIKKNALAIKLTQNNINAAELRIQQLSLDITKNIGIIDQDSKVIAGLIVETNKADSSTLIENLLTHKDLSEFWNEAENIYKIQNQIREKIDETKNLKKILEDNKKETENKRKELLSLKASLQDQKSVLDLTKKEKSKLLAETKDKESNYQKILAEKKALSAAFDKELIGFESELRFAINPNSYPSTGKGILAWPLDVIRITQKFGVTNFSKTTNAYNGQGHNGVDFGAPIGTRVKAALSGTVIGTGNTDTVCPGASYGKWIFVQHNNGLSTIYAHLSLIKVKTGDQVFVGDTIGYTGLTGFTTGPHLHFGLYVTQGVKILTRKSSVCGGTYTIPVADLRAYLDPLQYL
jgi:murein DD-endopeptidase MepM/ murein hydrolase activator NlpD